ncbi:MAG: metal-dependent transcriptional regulator [Oscillospiraceae bacterium]|nr:metal-dependent transcriptional regulator [Oscillospiraceae bacterium]
MSGKGTKSRVNTAGENYLEAILILEDCKKVVRSVDLAEQMGVTKPSVSRAVHILENEGLVIIDRDHFLHLTEAGREIAEKIYERHVFFTKALIRLGVDPDQAETDACELEHVISDKAFSILKARCQGSNAGFARQA